MSFRPADFRHAVLGAAIALTFALSASAVTAQEAKPAAATSAAPAAAATAAAAPVAAPIEGASMAVKPGDASVGQGKAAVCGACHGLDGNSSDPQYPKLAGQHESYIARQLTNFKSAKRQNAIMMGMAAPLSEQDMHDIGAYFSTKVSRPGVADEALVELGQQLYREGDAARGIPACMACHLTDGRGNPGAVYPQLAGQHAQYVEATLKAWHDGTVWGDDAHAQIMPAIAKKLDTKDITALASYIEGLHSADSGDTAAP
ncbi:c-type cytochrome [Dyella sp.]|jgi:cytochrome c553|uniref:c-type cytochrome n=1 Tax=Dyella sp. TaxID=1869338 RepID=UPI002D76B7B8|nr:c-type cytochrome [Dyella sp.]HET6431918.1 c-type cytochrome [Dyella sp.]